MYITEITTVDTHTMGEATRIVVNGFPEIKGGTMMEKKNYVLENFDHLRKILMHEPRGHKDMFGAIITKPVNIECDLGVIFMDGDSYLNMCGHGTIGTITMCINKGLIPRKEIILIDVPSGIIECHVEFNKDVVKNVSFQNVPSFILHKDLAIELPNFGKIEVDVVFGGSFFGIIKAEKVNPEINLSEKEKIIALAMRIRDILNTKFLIEHPSIPSIKTVDLIEISREVNKKYYKNVVIFGEGQIDRSPCGTGTCAKLATLDLDIGESIVQESILGSKFIGTIKNRIKYWGYNAVVTSVTGSAWITGEHKFVLQEGDMYPEGFEI